LNDQEKSERHESVPEAAVERAAREAWERPRFARLNPESAEFGGFARADGKISGS